MNIPRDIHAAADKVRERALRATPGPWAQQRLAGNLVYGDPEGGGTFVTNTGAGTTTEQQDRVAADAAHIAT